MQAEQVDITMRTHFLPDSPGAALMILREGECFAEGYGLADLHTGARITTDTTFRIASLTKQFTAHAIRILESQAALSLHEPIARFFPSFPVSLGQATAWQLLHHTSGISDYESLLAGGRTAPLRDGEVEALVASKGSLYFKPGTKFRYSNTGYCLLARLLEKISGLSFARFMDRYIFGPLAMSHSQVPESGASFSGRAFGYHYDGSRWRWADQDVTSATQGDGGLYTSAEDYCKWLMARLPSPAEIKWPPAHLPAVGERVWYHDGWFLGEEADGTHCRFHSGESTGFRHIVYCNEKHGLAVILFSNGDGDQVARAFSFLANMWSLSPVTGSFGVSLYQWLHQVYQAGSG